MSYRDLRNFSEVMRALGFPRPVSLDSFRTPNWELVEECLRWLAARLEPDTVLAGGRGSAEQRVALVTHAAALFHSRANVKLSGRRVYGAEGLAARELLKAAALLRAALAAPPPDSQSAPAHTYDLTARLAEIKQARALATDITALGAFLHDLLAKEPENKEHREQALSRPLDLAALEASVRRAVAAGGERVAAARERVDNVAASEAALDAKLERRRNDLQRAEKRLHTVQKIKPAYQGDLSALEAELAALWENYVRRFRCVQALRHQLSVLDAAHAEAAEEQQAAIMQLIQKYETEDVLGKLSDSDGTSSSGEDEGKEMSEAPRPATRPRTRLRIKTAGTSAAEARRAFGSMAAPGARDSLDDIRDEDDSRSDDDFSDQQLYSGSGAGAGGRVSGRWGRARPRPATRTLNAHDDYDDIVQGAEAEDADSLGSSSESELRLSRRASAAPGPPGPPGTLSTLGTLTGPGAGRASALSDNEF